MPASIDLPVSGADDGLYHLPRSRELPPRSVADALEDAEAADADTDADADADDADADDQDAIDLGPPPPSLPPAPPPAPSWAPFSAAGRDQLALLRFVAGSPEIHLSFRGTNVPTFTSAATIGRVDEDALADARRLPECQRYMSAAAELDKLARATRAARANLEFAESQLNVLLHEGEGEGLPERKLLVEEEITQRKAALAKAETLERSAASIVKVRWAAAYDALGRSRNTAAIKASREAAERLNELARTIAEKVKDELLELAKVQGTWDGLGVLVSAPRRPSHTGLLEKLKAEAIGSPLAKTQAEEPKMKPTTAAATTTATA
jgi:hypothetical protein